MQSRKLDSEKLSRKLHSAMRYAKHTCVIGSSNRMADIVKTNGWSSVLNHRRHYLGNYSKAPFNLDKHGLFNNRYDPVEGDIKCSVNQWHYRPYLSPKKIELYARTEQDPKADPQFGLNENQKQMLIDAMLARDARIGRCMQMSCLVGKYLWEHSDGIKQIECVAMGLDHVFVVVNREGDLHRPETWGDAWIIDAWYKDGLILHASEFKTQIACIKQFILDQTQYLKMLGLPYVKPDHRAPDIRVIEWAIDVKKTPYPSYDKHMKFEDYYLILDDPFENIYEFIECREEHEKRFQGCLNGIRKVLAPTPY